MAPDDVCAIDAHSREVLLALQSVIATLVVSLHSEHPSDTGSRANAATPTELIGAGEPSGTQGTLAPFQTGVTDRIEREINHSLMHTIDRLIGMLEHQGMPRSAEPPMKLEPTQTDLESVVS